MAPLITIGIPCYNAEAWLQAAIESALAQSWPEKEVIVIDDGSTDQSVAIAQKFGDAIRLHRTANHGVNRARNEIIRLARGEWIQYLDADDYLLPEKVATQLKEAAPVDHAGIIYSPVYLEDWTQGSPRARTIEAIDVTQDLHA